ncbi:glycosyltransferase [Polynucleobacter sp. AP-Jannik-300A-C4]|uniref:glycosyltransferase family protein n=1 Tax=Polynucleobacter sp. AP-Jannik-300A-C4 TaxID=2576928 RepID=UPI001BFD2417|nr:glycosyltransferase [Polynucleobacter sp. AP-Jannik-300A-C4]QWE22875.1 glycosyltransferase [Polynucleobacter sp. AP-Jannik-300A-C4]
MTRILIVYQSKPAIVPGLKKGFENAGVETITFLANEHHHWVDKYVFHAINKWAHNLRLLKKGKFLFSNHPLTHWNYLNTELVKFYKKNNPDYVFFIHGIHYSESTLTQINAPKIAWLVDPVQDPKRLALFSKNLDWYFSYSKFAIRILQELGFKNTSYLPHAVDHNEFRHIPDTKKPIDISFVGKHSVHREKFILAALEVTSKVSLYGSRWVAPALSKPSLLKAIKGIECYGEKLNNLYNSSKVVLSIIAKPENALEAQSGINMRPYEILASGSILCSDNYDELHPELINNENLILFNNVDEFKQSLSQLLKDKHKIENIAASGRRFIESRFSYDEMAKTILAKFKEVKDGTSL